MTKHFCDRCETDCTEGANQFSLKCHIVEGTGYVDRHRNPVSGRLVDYLLCNHCYNVVAGAAFQAFKARTNGE